MQSWTGQLQKSAYGAWVLPAMRLLAGLRRVRGTWLDPFGWSRDRRTERGLIADYEATIAELLGTLAPERHALAVEIARVPEQIRGFGHVKERHLRAAKEREAALLRAYREPQPARGAAAR